MWVQETVVSVPKFKSRTFLYHAQFSAQCRYGLYRGTKMQIPEPHHQLALIALSKRTVNFV